MIVLYYEMDAVSDSGENTPLKLLLSVYNDATLDLTGVNELLADPAKFNNCVYQGYDIQFVKLSPYPNPFIILGGTVPEGTRSIRINTVYDNITKHLNGASKLSGELEQKFLDILTNQLQDKRIAHLSILCCYALKDLLTKDQHIITNINASRIASDFSRQTQDWITEINRRNTMAGIPNNETKFQSVCSDELFIKLPAYDAMFNYLATEEDETEQQELRDLHVFLPARMEVSDPYGTNAAKYEDPDSVTKMMELGGQVYESALKEIVGNPNNNTDEIFENEKRYFDSLNKWMGIIATDSEGQDNGEMCSISLEYMHTLTETLYIWYWQHNRRVPCSIELTSGELVDDSRYVFKSDEHMGVAPEDLIMFLDRVTADLGREAYAKAAIQLARWGSRKQTAIVFDGYDKCFDLNEGVVRNSLPSLSSYDKVSIDGCDYKFVGLITDTTNIADKRIGFSQWPMPVGVALMQTFANKTSSDTINITSYYSMIDLVREIITGNMTVSGISYSEDGWTAEAVNTIVAMNEVIASTKQPDRLKFPIFRGIGMLQIYTDLHVASTNSDSHFSLMCSKLQSSKLTSFIDDNEFETYAGFDALTKTGKPGRKQAVDYMIVRDLLKVYHQAAVTYREDMSAAEIISLWHNAILESGYVDEAFFYTGVTKPSVPLPGCKTNNFKKCFWRPENPAGQVVPDDVSAQPRRMAVDTTDTRSTSASTAGRQVNCSSMVIMQPTNKCLYCKFVSANGTEFVSAVDALKKRLPDGTEKNISIFILLDRATASTLNLPEDTKVFPIERLLVHMTKAFYAISRNSPKDSTLRFINSDAIAELHKYFTSLLGR